MFWALPPPAKLAALSAVIASVSLLVDGRKYRAVVQDPAHTARKMTPPQEVCNALTMVGKAWLGHHFYATRAPGDEATYLWVAMWAQWIHLPFSAWLVCVRRASFCSTPAASFGQL